MKRTLLAFGSALLLGTAWSQVILISEDFESYTAGSLIAQTAGLPWSTWSVAPGTAEDAPVSDEQAYSGTQSLKIAGVAAGGPPDLILRLCDRTSGNYGLSWMMYVPSGFGGYFNIQRNEVPGAGSWMLDVTFAPDGSIEYLVNSVAAAGTYPLDEWFSLILAINLSAGTGAVAINGVSQYTWQTTVPGPNQIGGIDFFAYAGGAPDVPTFYVDDVLFIDLTSLSVDEIAADGVLAFPNPSEGHITIDLGSASAGALISVVDVTGRTVASDIRTQRAGQTERALVDLSSHPDGLYFIRIADGGREIVRRVTKY
ncbi:MAG: T9SS type A sorting domain-containing protein [Flavobacteriales bacterium]|nr:T9SS type A sorting domain-containing protein [Flavobacteriales bacterium]